MSRLFFLTFPLTLALAHKGLIFTHIFITYAKYRYEKRFLEGHSTETKGPLFAAPKKAPGFWPYLYPYLAYSARSEVEEKQGRK